MLSSAQMRFWGQLCIGFSLEYFLVCVCVYVYVASNITYTIWVSLRFKKELIISVIRFINIDFYHFLKINGLFYQIYFFIGQTRPIIISEFLLFTNTWAVKFHS